MEGGRQILSFVVVGGLSAAAYLGAMAFAVETLKLSPTLGAAIGFAAGTAVSYIGNSIATFRSAMTAATAARFLVVVGAGLLLNQAIAWAITATGGHYLLIFIAVFLIVPAFNFAGHRYFTFADRPR